MGYKAGILEFVKARLFASNKTNYVEIKAPTNVSQNHTISLPSAPPTETKMLNININGQIGYTDLTNSTLKGEVPYLEQLPETQETGIIFSNEFYDTPLYRKPNNGSVHKITLSQYKVKNCIYASNGDANGLAYWAGTNFGASAWSAPGYNNGIFIYTSGSIYDENYNLIDGDVLQLLNRSNSIITTADSPNSYFDIRFFTGDEKLYLNGIYLKSPNAETYGFLKSWDIQCLDYNNTIFYQESFVNKTELLNANAEIYIPINSNTNSSCTAIIIKQTNVNSIGTNHLALGEIEFYGLFK